MYNQLKEEKKKNLQILEMSVASLVMRLMTLSSIKKKIMPSC